MPGDVVALYDAKLGGRKGLTSYHQEVGGAGEPLVGIVNEFEPKKSKIKVFQANQHVGQQVSILTIGLDEVPDNPSDCGICQLSPRRLEERNC